MYIVYIIHVSVWQTLNTYPGSIQASISPRRGNAQLSKKITPDKASKPGFVLVFDAFVLSVIFLLFFFKVQIG